MESAPVLTPSYPELEVLPVSRQALAKGAPLSPTELFSALSASQEPHQQSVVPPDHDPFLFELVVPAVVGRRASRDSHARAGSAGSHHESDFRV